MNAGDAAFSLLAGAVAAFNPCGFALLPAYLTMIVSGSADARLTRVQALRRAIIFGLAMTLGFAGVFTGFGLLFGGVNVALQGSVLPYLAYVTVALGVVITVLGVAMASGREARIPGLRLSPAGVAGRAPRADVGSQVAYGASFALASLTCTIGPFFGVVSFSLNASNPVGAIAPFVIYAAGMGGAVLVISIAAAFAGSAVGRALRERMGLILRASGVVLALAGIWVIVYGLAEVLLRFGNTALNPVLIETSAFQGRITTAVSSWGTPVLVTVLALVAAFVIAVFALAARERRAAPPAADDGDRPDQPAARASATSTLTAPSDVLDAVRKATKR